MLNKYYPSREFKALLFDFDGTVADTMGVHLAAWNHGLSIYNLTLSREQHLAWAGRPTRMIVQMLNELHKVDIPVDEFLKAKEVNYFASVHEVKEIVSVVEIIKHYHGKIPMAIVTGSRHKPVETTLSHLGLTKYFDHLVCAEDYVHGKPAPDCFLRAAELLNVRPEDCLVFEDAALGIEAAKNAGMACLKVDDRHELMVVEF
ncbi:HAD family hydrolase [Bdellovibrio svalbardensis]|uniref:HAD-IA family hydrolase n=1 Tax=Bdellovibrio svalbardensis TaxID=2972972 RepID=A0ABT6DEA0_9BACT|nr:HAD-IA family hydrolase [Bdellovibrio svalbardensis]MDG0815153.1 HAD-IA family hydrolase [Bdellovibrio svalbardensis]